MSCHVGNYKKDNLPISGPYLSTDVVSTSSCRSRSMEACGHKGLTHMFYSGTLQSMTKMCKQLNIRAVVLGPHGQGCWKNADYAHWIMIGDVEKVYHAAGTQSRCIKVLPFRDSHTTYVDRIRRPGVRRRYRHPSLYARLSRSRGLLFVSLRWKSRRRLSEV